MSEKTLACPKCGAAVSPDAAQGLCPKCLLQQASFPTEATSGTRFRPDPPPIETLSAAFPHLEILELIGRGGMGFVFKARQPKLDRLVALKILAETLSADPSFAERFTREARALARLNHPNIVTIHDFGQAGPFFYLLMEFVDGVNLRQAMQAKQVSATEALAIVPKICEALQYAHSEGILHRDIKPDNILLDARGRVKIADFGIAKLLNQVSAESALTDSGATLGTVHYMAPEQIERPNEVDHRADIYSLGVVFYEMLTGELPIGRFPAPSEKSAVDPRLDKVVFKTLAKEPAKRQQSAGELGTDVETISHGGEDKRARVTSVSSRYGTRFVIGVGVAVLLAAGVFIGARILRKSRYAAYAPPSNTPDLLSTQPDLVTPLNGESQITVDSIKGSPQQITAESASEFHGGETVHPVIAYAHSPWAKTATSTRYSLERNGTNRVFKTAFQWNLPPEFATAFDVIAEMQRVSGSLLHRPASLGTNSVLEVFSLTNKEGQVVSGGLQLSRENRVNSESAFATLSNFDGKVRGEGDGRSTLTGTFSARIPDGFRLETFYTLNQEVEHGFVFSEEPQTQVRVQWPGLGTEALRVPMNLADRGTIQVPTNASVELFLVTNVFTPVIRASGNANGYPAYKDDPSGKRTNIIRGIVQLVPIPVNASDSPLVYEPPLRHDNPSAIGPTDLTRPVEAAAGESSITLDYVQGTPEEIILNSKSEFGPDKEVQAVIAYARGPWAPSMAAGSTYSLQREGTNHLFYTSYNWSLPKAFATAFDVNAELQRVTSSSLHRSLPLSTNSVLEVFSLTNKEGKIISGGLQLVQNPLPTSSASVAVLRKFSGNLTQSSSERTTIRGSFFQVTLMRFVS